MRKEPIKIEIFTIPQAACDASKANWQQVAQMVARQLVSKFGESVSTNHIEFMSPEWFQHESAQRFLESGGVNFPFVLVNNEIASANKKINIPQINKTVNELLSI